MQSFRFSPINNKEQLIQAIEYIHFQGYKLCLRSLGILLPVAGNIGFFCHFQDEFEQLINIRKEITDINDNWNQKYYRLYEPLVIPAKDGIPTTKYTYLYIRKPDETHPQVGDVDFYLKPDKYKELKQSVIDGKFNNGVSIFDRPDLDLVSLSDPGFDVTAFVGSYNLEVVAQHGV